MPKIFSGIFFSLLFAGALLSFALAVDIASSYLSSTISQIDNLSYQMTGLGANDTRLVSFTDSLLKTYIYLILLIPLGVMLAWFLYSPKR